MRARAGGGGRAPASLPDAVPSTQHQSRRETERASRADGVPVLVRAPRRTSNPSVAILPCSPPTFAYVVRDRVARSVRLCVGLCVGVGCCLTSPHGAVGALRG